MIQKNLTRNHLYPYQCNAIEYVKDKKRCGLWLDMGMGKTTITLTALTDFLDSLLISKVLIISPLRVAQSVWSQEASLWEHLKHLTFSVCCGSVKERIKALMHNADVHLINNENIKWLVEYYKNNWPFDCIVIDEASCFKNASSKRFKALKKIINKTTHMILLTGTPAPNSYLNLWSQTFLIDKGVRLGKTMSEYKIKYFDCDYFGYNWTLKKNAKPKINALLKDIYSRLKLNDYFDDLRFSNVNHFSNLPEKVQKQYIAFKNNFLINFEDDHVVALNAAVLANKLLQFSNGFVYENDSKKYRVVHTEKLNQLEKLIASHPNENFLIAYNFIADKEQLLKKFTCAVVMDNKSNVIERWNEKKIKILLAHPKAAGHGLNLQRGGGFVVWYGLCWSLELYKQFNARLIRPGQEKSVKIIHLLVKGTLDEHVLNVLNNKDSNQKSLLNALERHCLNEDTL